jgi:hypothetical protein
MAEKQDPKQGWADRRREKKRLKLERTGDSPEKRAHPERRSGNAAPDDPTGRATSANVAGGGIL